MTTPLLDAVAALVRAQADFTSGKLSSMGYRDQREAVLPLALVAMAEAHGLTLQQPLHIDANGEYSVIALNPHGPVQLHGCAPFGEAFAQALNTHQARTGTQPGTLSACNGWCRLHHLQAEQMVRLYAAAQAKPAQA